MGALASLVVLSVGMGLFTFFFGLLPLTLRLSRVTLRVLEVGGAGLLLGAACAVVLPEGAGTLFRDHTRDEHGHGHSDHEHRRQLRDVGIRSAEDGHWEPENLLAISFLTGVLVMFVIDQLMAPSAHSHDMHQDEELQVHSSSSHFNRRRSRSTTHPSSNQQQQQQQQRQHRHQSRSFQRLTRPESLVLTRSSAITTSKDLEEGRGQGLEPVSGPHMFDGLPAPPSPHRIARSSTPKRSSDAARIAANPLREEASPAGSEGDEATLPADYETFSHANSTNGHRFRSLPKEAGDGGGLNSSSGQVSDPLRSPLLAPNGSPPYSPPRRPSRASRSRSSHRHVGTGGQPGGLRRAFTSIAGLLIHAACDGIAMGASSASKDEGLKLVVVGAIMIHKAPAAFGLCSLLLSQRLSRSDIKRAMGIFSLATPIGAIGTYLLLSLFFTDATSSGPSSSSSSSSLTMTISPRHVGSALTFSAGSFLFVALDAVHDLASHSADVQLVQIPLNGGREHRDLHDARGGEEGGGGGGGGGSSSPRTSHPRSPSPSSLSSSSTSSSTGTGSGTANGTITVEREILGRFARMGLLIFGAALPRSLQMVFGHGH